MLLASLALADTLDPRATHPWAIRGELEVLTAIEWGAPLDTLPAVTVSWAPSRRCAVDATVGYGVGPARSGVHGQVVLRYIAGRDSARSAGATFAAGPRVAAGSDFGTIASLVAEVGVDVRAATGFSFAAGGGPVVFLNDSREVERRCSGFCSSEQQFRVDALGIHGRVGAGWSF